MGGPWTPLSLSPLSSSQYRFFGSPPLPAKYEQFEPLVNFNRYSCLFLLFSFFFLVSIGVVPNHIYIYTHPIHPSIHPPHRIVVHISYHTCIPTPPTSNLIIHVCIPTYYSSLLYIFFLLSPPVIPLFDVSFYCDLRYLSRRNMFSKSAFLKV